MYLVVVVVKMMTQWVMSRPLKNDRQKVYICKGGGGWMKMVEK